jgi:hypothetical protein
LSETKRQIKDPPIYIFRSKRKRRKTKWAISKTKQLKKERERERERVVEIGEKREGA